MPVPEVFVLQAWEKAGGRCGCRRWSHNHSYVVCNRRLAWEGRGRPVEGGWAPRFRTSASSDIPLDCEILCFDCHQRALADEIQGR